MRLAAARLLLLLTGLVAAPGAVRAETPPAQAIGPRASETEPATAANGRSLLGREPAWNGPRVRLSYRLLPLRDDLGGRMTHAAGFAGFLPTRFVRAGAGIEAGARTQAYSGNEGLVSGSLFVGYQLLQRAEPALPYLVGVGELGTVFGKHFHTPVSHLIRGAGLELGCDLRVARGLSAGVAMVFMMYTMDGLAYDSWGLRASVGL